jgi:hypothetical protein
VREADNLTTFMCRMSWKSGSLNLLELSVPDRACYGTPLHLMRTYVSLPTVSVSSLYNRKSSFGSYIDKAVCMRSPGSINGCEWVTVEADCCMVLLLQQCLHILSMYNVEL